MNCRKRRASATPHSVVRIAASALRRSVIRIVVIALVIGALFALSGRGDVGSAATGDPVVAVSGDVACAPGKASTATSCQQGKTGALLTSINPDYVLPLGDSQYDSGTSGEYAGSYDGTGWGTAKGVSRPAAGNHEYRTTGATGYYGYFGSNAGDPTKGYYSWDVNGPNNSFRWHLIALNSECALLGGGSISAGCGVGSTQEAWLKADLAANKNVCTLAYWHRPRFSSSSTTPSSTTYTAFWNDLYNAGADVVLNGHAHDYERFAPQTGAGTANPNGLSEFVVGTGGDNFQTMGPPIANSMVRNASAFGVMKLTLHANTYDWQFVAASGYTLSDSGSATCHTVPAPDTAPPSAPTNVSWTAASPNQVNLAWTASSDNVGVTNYKIYRGANGATPGLLATTTTNTATYTDTSVSASTTYTYQVQAIDAAGNVSAMSSPAATVTTPSSADTTPPSAPSLLNAESVSYNEIDLGWAASTDETGGTGVSGYRVFRKGPGDTSYTLLATTAGTGAGSTSYFDTTVKPSSSYSYYVTAFDGASNVSGPSNTLVIATPAGPASQAYTFTAAGDATIKQASPTVTGGTTSPLIVDNSPVDDALIKFNVATTSCDTLTSAKLTLTNNSDGSVKGGDFYTTGQFNETSVSWSDAPTRGTLLNSLGAVASNATVSVDVTQGTPLNGEADFRVGTTSSDGVHYFSREGTGGKPTLTVVCTSAQVKDTTPPSAPPALTATAAASGEVDLAWQGSTDNIAVTEYHIYRGSTQIGIVPATSLTYQDTTVSSSTTYSYTVRAFDAAGNSSGDSNTASATTPASSAPPAAPTNLAATTTSSTSVSLSWTASTNSTVTGYNVYRGPHGGALALISSSGSSPAVDATASPGTTYDYAVTAVATGSPESARSNIATVTTPGSGGGTGITAGTARVTQVTTASTTWTVNLPTFAAGDFVVVWIGNNLGSTAGTPTSSGWTTQLMTNESSGLKGSFLTRRMVSGDPTSITVTWSGSTSGVAEAVAFTGVNAATPVDVKGGQAEASTTALATHSTPSLTTTVQDVLVSGFTTDKASTWTSSGTEAGTELADSASGALSAVMYYTTPVAAGTHVQSATATTASVKAVSGMLALRPF